jgi:hypothetical protein
MRWSLRRRSCSSAEALVGGVIPSVQIVDVATLVFDPGSMRPFIDAPPRARASAGRLVNFLTNPELRNEIAYTEPPRVRRGCCGGSFCRSPSKLLSLSISSIELPGIALWRTPCSYVAIFTSRIEGSIRMKEPPSTSAAQGPVSSWYISLKHGRTAGSNSQHLSINEWIDGGTPGRFTERGCHCPAQMV